MAGPFPTSISELAARLRSPQAAVRRIAIADLSRAAEFDPAATGVLAGHLAGERDEKAAIAIIRHLGRLPHSASKAALWALYADRATPARIAHAAILAHDAIELSEHGRNPTMGACRAEQA